MRVGVGMVLGCCVALGAVQSMAEVIEVEGTVKKVLLKGRTLTFLQERIKDENESPDGRPRKKPQKHAKKRIEVQVSEDAVIRVGEWTIGLEDIEVGDEVAMTYDTETSVVSDLTKDRRKEKSYSALLRRKFAASQATLNPSSGVLTLSYDLAKPGETKDFRFNAGALTISQGAAKVAPVEGVTHIAVFKTGSIKGRFAYGNNQGEQIMLATTTATSLRFHKFNEFWLQLFSEGREIARKDFGDKKPLPILYEITETKMRIEVNGQQLAGLRVTPANCGAFVMHGGNAGLAVAELVISGVPDGQWMKAFVDTPR
jgi:hypothetical protein